MIDMASAPKTELRWLTAHCRHLWCCMLSGKLKRTVCAVRWLSRAPGMQISFFHYSTLDLFLKLEEVFLKNDLFI